MSNTDKDKVRKLLAKDDNGLLPCPFCGAELYHAKENYYYRCKTDGCFLSTHFVSELQIDEYNTRPPALSELLERKKELEAEVLACNVAGTALQATNTAQAKEIEELKEKLDNE